MPPKDSKLYFWRRRGWLRYPLLVVLLTGTAVALRGGLWSQTPAKAAKRAANRSLKAKPKSLPKVQMYLEHNERDINLKIKKGKHVLPNPVITREDRKVTVELAGVQVRPRKWTLSGSRVSSINVRVDKKGSRLIIAQDPKVQGTLKDAFSAEDVNGNLVLRVLNQSIGDRQAHPTRLASHTTAPKVVGASTAPAVKAKHPLSQKLNHRANHAPSTHHPAPAHPKVDAHHGATAHPKTHHAKPVHAKAHSAQPGHATTHHGDTAHANPHHADTAHPTAHHGDAAHAGPSAHHETAPSKDPHQAEHHAPVQVVEHPTSAPDEHAAEEHDAGHPSMLKSALSMAASVLAFGLLALIPVLWWKKKQTSPAADIKVQERLALSPKHSLVRVKLGAQDLWLGLSEGNIQVITPAQSSASRPGLAIVPEPAKMTPRSREHFEDDDHEILPEPMPAPAPPTMAKRKLAAFKHRLREALSHPDTESDMDIDQDAGRQADAIRKELARRQSEQAGSQDTGFQENVA